MGVRIGIPVPTAADLAYNRKDGPVYEAAVTQAGAEPVSIRLGLTMAEMRALATECDGFVLPGSPADVAPELYGQMPEPGTAPVDAHREECDRYLLEHATETGKPVLAICFGAQFLNVWRGGSLVQDLAPLPVNHSAGSSVAVAHSVIVAGQSLLASLMSGAEAPAEGEFRRLTVNSSHHQAVSGPGQDMAVVARSVEDGVIEAVEGRVGLASMLGVQWHPERSVGISAASRALFAWVVSEAEDWRMRAEGADEGDV